MSIFTPSMYGVGKDFAYNPDVLNPVTPLGPNWPTQDQWWFRGPQFRALAPGKGNVTELPAGKDVTFEIGCNVAFTSFGVTPTVVGSNLDACPNNSGAYHSGDPTTGVVDDSQLSGCALAIADVDDIGKVTWDNLAVFSVQTQCVKQKMTSFEVPKMMPSCTGEKCICGWFWLANQGQANFYMTAFDCNVTGSLPSATPIAAPTDPVFCETGNSTCKLNTGSKRPLYAYNQPTNVQWEGNDDRPGYHSSWSFNDGAQDGIFEPAAKSATSQRNRISACSFTQQLTRQLFIRLFPQRNLISACTFAPELQQQQQQLPQPIIISNPTFNETISNSGDLSLFNETVSAMVHAIMDTPSWNVTVAAAVSAALDNAVAASLEAIRVAQESQSSPLASSSFEAKMSTTTSGRLVAGTASPGTVAAPLPLKNCDESG
ncbi:hypothetical protein RQP46_007965 [Phenoliferia psychrophenolica]